MIAMHSNRWYRFFRAVGKVLRADRKLLQDMVDERPVEMRLN
jgi:hypothetical protein